VDKMSFQTYCQVEESPFQINYQEKILGMGSCFVENIGDAMLGIGFRGVINPFGIMYNPVSISDSLSIFRGEQAFYRKDLFLSSGLYRHWKVHSQLSQLTEEGTYQALLAAQKQGSKQYRQSTVLLLTLGSAYVWKKDGIVVANCHKMPSVNFQRTLLSVSDMLSLLQEYIEEYLESEGRKVIVTVSPVRYLRDGLVNSNRSKGRLLEVVHRIAESNQRVYYFPAYEIVNDQLRDYRFFKEDMVHPTSVAIDYVWQRFKTVLFDDVTQQYCLAAEQVQKMKAHQLQFPHSEEAIKFTESLQRKEIDLSKKYPFCC